MNEGQIFIEGVIVPETLDNVKRQLAATSNDDSLCIHISSPGGSVYTGYKIFHAIKQSASQTTTGKPKPIRGVIEGEAQSMATFISAIADKGKLEIADPSRYMIHNPKQGVEGDSDALTGGADELRMIENEMADVYSHRTGLPVDQIKAMMKKETSMTAQEAVRLGFADKISQHLRAVALGKTMKPKANILKQISQLFKEATAEGVVALDLNLQDGTVLTSDAQSEDTIQGSNVMIAGAAAPDGDYTTVDGMVLTVAAGVVTNVVDPADALAAQIADLQAKLTQAKTKKVAPVPAKTVPVPAPKVPAPSQEGEDKIAALQAQLDALKAEKERAISEKTEVEATVTALATQFEELKKKTVGDDNRPNTGMQANRKPFAIGSAPTALGINMTRHFIAQELPWLEDHYKMRGVDTGWFRDYEKAGPVMTSIVQTNFNFTFPGILTTDILYKPSIDTPAISDMFTIDQNIKFQKQYNLVQVLSNILKGYGGCGPTPGNSNNDKVNINNATVLTKEFRMEEAWCKDDFTSQLTGVYNNLAQEWLRTGEASFDPAGTPMDTVIQTVLTDALRRDVFQRLTMAAGNSSNGNYNQIDGLWDRLIDSSGASNYCVLRAQGIAALGIGTPSAATATAALEAVYIQSPTILKQNFNKAVFWVTGSIYDAYINQIVGAGNVSQAQYEALINGIQGNKTWDGGVPYKGIMVRPVRFWDASLADPNNPLFATTRNLVLLTVKQNHIAGVENGGDLNKIYSWYENKDSKRYYRADMKLGYNYLHCDLQTIAI